MHRSIKILWRMLPFVILFSSNIYSQTDSIFAEVKEDCVTINHKYTQSYCCLEFEMQFELNGNYLKIIEVDTSCVPCDCYCFYDFFVTIGSLKPGEYYTEVFRTICPYTDTTYLGFTSFSIRGLFSPQIPEILEQFQSDCYQLSEIAFAENMSPEDFNLSPVYPNPFNPETQIEFTIPGEGFVKVSVFNNNGQQIETLLEKELRKGSHQLIWDASKYSSGVYFISVEFGNLKKTQKAILLK
ncbi:MAG: T9SS type A sorting domain-containing protein [bacterium]